jgi:hypothetical protein
VGAKRPGSRQICFHGPLLISLSFTDITICCLQAMITRLLYNEKNSLHDNHEQILHVHATYTHTCTCIATCYIQEERISLKGEEQIHVHVVTGLFTRRSKL